MVQYKHTEHKQARRNERPLSAFVRGKRTLRKRERVSAYGYRETKRNRQREEGDSRLDHMTQSIVILSEKGLEWSISPSGRGKKRERQIEKQTGRRREGATQRGSKQRENERKY